MLHGNVAYGILFGSISRIKVGIIISDLWLGEQFN